MSIFYHYDAVGNLQASSGHDALLLTKNDSAQHDMSYYVQAGDVVGAYLTQRDMLYRKSTPTASDLYDQSIQSRDPSSQWYNRSSEAQDHVPQTYNDSIQPYDASLPSFNQSAQGYKPSCGADGEEHDGHMHDSTTLQHEDPRHADSRVYESCHYQSEEYSENFGIIRHTYSRSWTYQYHLYPIADHIRHLHTLHSLLPHIDPQRKLQALHGPVMHVVEQATYKILAHSIPKSLLVLFLGREPISRLIKTLGLYDVRRNDPLNRIQELCIPRYVSSSAAIKVLLAWMRRACEPNTMDNMYQFRVPHNTFAACTLAQTLTLFGLHKDALRVDYTIIRGHFRRPIFANELESLWKCLGENNRYIYANAKVIGYRLRESRDNQCLESQAWKEMQALLARYPLLDARVRDPELNEQFRPTFSTEWCRRLDSNLRYKPGHEMQAPGLTPHPATPAAGGQDQERQEKRADANAASEAAARNAAILRIVSGDGGTEKAKEVRD
jgi:hypothetical protein